MGVEESCFREQVSPNIEFLLQAYANTQQVIQFFDTKAGAYIAVNGVLVSLLVSDTVQALSDLSSMHSDIPMWLSLIGLGVIVLLYLSHLVLLLYQAFLVLAPRYGPDLVEKGDIVGLFWAGNIVEYLGQHSVDQYAATVSAMGERQLVSELSYETAKLSRITSIKLKHLRRATTHCKWAILLWAALLVGVASLQVVMPHLP